MATQRLDIPIRGMHCAACAGRIENALLELAGMQQAQVNFATEKATVHFDPAALDRPAISRKIEAVGYGVPDTDADDPLDPERLARTAEIRDLNRKFIVSLALGLPVMLGSMPTMFPWVPTWLREPYLLLALATPVQFWVGWPFYQGTWAALKQKSADMSSLIALGTTRRLFLQCRASPSCRGCSAVLVSARTLYFDTAVMILALIVLGRLLEARARGQTLRGHPQAHGPAGQDGPRCGATARPWTSRCGTWPLAILCWCGPGRKGAGGRCHHRGPLDPRRVDAHRREPAGGPTPPGDSCLRRHAQQGRQLYPCAPRGCGARYRAGADRPAGRGGARLQGAHPAAGRQKWPPSLCPAVIGRFSADVCGLAAVGPGTGCRLRPPQLRGRADHRLPLRVGTRHPDGHSGRHRQGRRAWHPVQKQSGSGNRPQTPGRRS